jgi:hypothetical protein
MPGAEQKGLVPRCRTNASSIFAILSGDDTTSLQKRRTPECDFSPLKNRIFSRSFPRAIGSNKENNIGPPKDEGKGRPKQKPHSADQGEVGKLFFDS